jgi:hypothetical protein
MRTAAQDIRDSKRALKYAREYRQTHIEWLEYWRENPPTSKEDRITKRSTGGIKYLQKSIKRYDVIIRVLEAAQSNDTESWINTLDEIRSL